MKANTKVAESLRSLLRKLRKSHDVPAMPNHEPVPAIVQACLCYDASDELVEFAQEKIRTEFIDHNELRVATELEVQALLGDDYPRIDERAAVLRNVLHSIFDREHSYKLDRLVDLKKAELRDYLADLTLMTPYVEAYVAMTAFGHSAVPIDDTMTALLVDEQILDEGTPCEQAQQIVESAVKGDDCWPFYCVVRAEAFEQAKSRKSRKK